MSGVKVNVYGTVSVTCWELQAILLRIADVTPFGVCARLSVSRSSALRDGSGFSLDDYISRSEIEIQYIHVNTIVDRLLHREVVYVTVSEMTNVKANVSIHRDCRSVFWRCCCWVRTCLLLLRDDVVLDARAFAWRCRA